ncbi:TonB-dependent receptor plug domain-containing protein [Anaerospora hongkongensis]|uniref:TonB-dependent receptor plug domain-containing protein n=1 Tax=Anaerospora hongkongensis TaxID=244830 RepID=UPI0028A12774|nr:TonB-dependent receptor [Anaerospora hongkongensis]
MKQKDRGINRKAWLCAMVVTSAVLLQAPGAAFAEEQQEFALDQVVVTANRVPTTLAKAAANVTVITREQLENNNYTGLGDALRDVNGVIVSVAGGFPGAPEVVRLNGDERVTVMIDGRKIGRPEGIGSGRASIDLNSIISMDNIERIEVVKGGASALYGSDAVGGVINIITRKGTEAKTTLDMSAGSWGERNYSLNTQGSENGLSWYFTADRKTQDYAKYNVLNPSLTPGSSKGDSYRWPNSKFEGQGVTFRLDKTIDENRSVTFNFEHFDDEGGRPSKVKDWSDSSASHLSNNWALAYNFNQKQDVPGFLRVYGNYNNQGFFGTYKSRSQGFEYQTGWQIDDSNQLISGIDVTKGEVLSNVKWDGATNYQDKSVINSAIYLQDIYTVTEKITVTPGVRYDHHSKFGGQISPKFNVNYSADKNTDVYVSYNRVFKAPNLDDLYYNSVDDYGAGGKWILKGDPNLNPEKGHVISAGVNKKLNNNTSLSANYFISKLTDAIDWSETVYDAATNTYSSWVRNIDKQKKRGFELDIHNKLSDKYYTDIGYSYVHVENNEANAGYTIDPTNSQPNGYRVKVGFTDAQWNVNINGQSAAGRDTSRFVDSSYWVWNLATNYKVNDSTKVYFNIYNLGDKPYELVSSGTSEKGNYPMASRHFTMGVKYSF